MAYSNPTPTFDFNSPTAPTLSGEPSFLTYEGPQQMRKPPGSTSAEAPRHNVEALLNPKAAPATISREASKDEEINGDIEVGAGSMIERLHGVTNRDDMPVKKRKIQEISDDDSDAEQRKKQKTEALHIGKGGMISDHLKNERKAMASSSAARPSDEPIITNRDDMPVKKRKIQEISDDNSDAEQRKKQKTEALHIGKSGMISDDLKNERKAVASSSAARPSDEPIDLTGDDDDVAPADDKEVTIAKVVAQGKEEICLGLVHANALVHRLPAVPQSLMRNLPKTHWPYMKISFRREASRTNQIDLLDGTETKFGNMDLKVAGALCPLLDGVSMNRMRVKMHLLHRPRSLGEEAGKKVSTMLKMTVTLFAPRDKASQIGRWLSQKQLFLSAPLTTGGRELVNPHEPKAFGFPEGGSAKPQGFKVSSSSYVTRSVEEIRREATNMFDSLAKNETIPSMEPNTSIISTSLMEHQKKALTFLFEHERSDFEGNELPSHALWKFRPKNSGRPAWYHVITGQEVTEKPMPVQGGILADMMGLGKTLSILAIIAETQQAARRFRQESVPDDVSADCNAKGTLIICPKSVMSNWEEQILAHCADGNGKSKLSVYCYHGSNRTQVTERLAKYDIVLTTYNTAAAEFADGMKKKRALSKINWFRIVLDEAHQIRTTVTKVSKACCDLHAQRRWAVTGTPVQNSLSDLGALIKFLRIPPFDSTNTWNQYIMSPFKMGNTDVIEQLQLLVGSITLRRLKDTIGITKRTETIERLTFTDSEAALYKQFAQNCRTQFQNVTDGGNTLRGKAYAHVLKSIGRLRAICAHGREMLTEEDLKEVEGDDPNNAIVLDIGDEPGLESEEDFTSDAQAYSLYRMMRDSEMARCESCGRLVGKKECNKPAALVDEEEAEDENASNADATTPEAGAAPEARDDDEQDLFAHMTPCYHLICTNCTKRYREECDATMTADRWHKCPFDESHQHFGMKPLTHAGLEAHLEERSIAAKQPKAAKWDEGSYTGPHTKVQALLEELKQSGQESADLATIGEPPIRSVVFSGWTAYLDLIEHALIKNRICFVRLDGSMSVKQRSQAMERFKTENDVVVMLVSIKAGGQGLNFTAANKVYVMEPQFNPGVEAQAVDRVHRLGQKRDVFIKRYVMEHSIEEGILGLQEKKNKLAQMSLEKKRSKAEENKQRMEDLKALFK